MRNSLLILTLMLAANGPLGCVLDDPSSEGTTEEDRRPRRDGGSPNDGGSSDAGTDSGVDAGEPIADAGQPSVDAGAPSVDAGEPSVDAGEPSVDAGEPSVDAGEPSVDAGTPATDAGAPPPATPDRVAFVSDRSGADRIYVADADGTNVTDLTAGGGPAWRWDGTQIAFHRAGMGIYVIDVDGSNEHFLRAGWSPTWSPDGTRIAYFYDDPAYLETKPQDGIYMMNSDGSNPTLLLSSEFARVEFYTQHGVFTPSWSPDGTRIAFHGANYDTMWGIYVMNIDGTNPPSPNDVLWGGSAPSWSPDGSEIAFSTWSRYSNVDYFEIAGVAPTGGTPRTLVRERSDTAYVDDADYTRDGLGIVYAYSAPVGGPSRIHIRRSGSSWQLIPEANNPVKLGYRDNQPAWSR